MSKHIALWLLLLIVIAGLSIRSYQLTARSLWFDEAFSWRLLQFSNTEMLSRAAADVHPPLYYLILKAWSLVFGSSLLSLRSFSVTSAALTIAAAYLFTNYATLSRPTGLTAALLLALSGFQIQYAQEARMYTLGTTLLLVSSYFLLKAIRESSLRYWLAYAASTVALAYVHYFALFSIAGQLVFVLGYLLVRTRGRLGEMLDWRQTWYAALAVIAMLVLYLPWLPAFLSQNAQVQQTYWIPPPGGWSVPDTFYRLFIPTTGTPPHAGFVGVLIAVSPLVLTVIGWLWLVKRARAEANWLVMLSGFVPFILAIVISLISQSLYQDRFFIFTHIFIVIGLAMLLSRLRPAWFRYATLTLIIFGFAAASLSYWLELDIPDKPGAHAATKAIFEQYQTGQPVLVSSPFIFFAVDHYAREEFNLTALTAAPRLYSETGQLLHFAGGPILTAADIVGPEIFKTDASTIWVVDTTGFGGSRLVPPPPWQPAITKTYPEVFPYQGDVLVTRYSR